MLGANWVMGVRRMSTKHRKMRVNVIVGWFGVKVRLVLEVAVDHNEGMMAVLSKAG
jgi:hypothetical protein